MALIEFEHVSKTFTHTGGAKLLRAHITDRFRRKQTHRETFYALKDVSFHVDRGECMAIVGGNGAGKSTLLSLVTGLAKPTAALPIWDLLMALWSMASRSPRCHSTTVTRLS